MEEAEDAVLLVRCEDLVQSQDLANKTWNSHRISPLHGFLPEQEGNIEAYSSSLTKHLSIECRAPEGQRFISSMYPLENVRESEASYAIVVGLENEDDGTFNQFCFLAVLCGIGWIPIKDDFHMQEEGFVFFPVLLTKGLKILSVGVADWLQKKFDCRTSLLRFTPHALAKMACRWAIALDEDTSQAFELKYTFPSYVSGLKALTLTIPASSMRRLHDRYRNSTGNELLDGIEEHFFHHFRITLSSLILTRVGTPMAYVSAEGRVKLSSAGPSEALRLIASFAVP